MNATSSIHQIVNRARLLAPIVAALPAVFIALPAQAERRALVIGNASYEDSPLKNPVNDARAVSLRLKGLNFRITEVENLKRDAIGSTIAAFISAIQPGDEVLFFYAGHGVQVKGENFFPAVDARIQSEDDVPLNSLNLNRLLARLDESKAGVKLLFLDACRNNPFARAFRGGGRGLAQVADAPSGTIIQYATRPGSVAADGSGANGLYTQELLVALQDANQPVETTLKRAAAGVKRESRGLQEPWMEGSLEGEFCFGTCGAPAKALENPTGKPAPGAEQIEDEYWAMIHDSRNAADFEGYLAQYPKGRYVPLAQLKMRSLRTVAGVATGINVGASAARTDQAPAQPKPQAVQGAAGVPAARKPTATAPVPDQAAPARCATLREREEVAELMNQEERDYVRDKCK